MRIDVPVLLSSGSEHRYTCNVHTKNGAQTLVFAINKEFTGEISDSSEAAVLALLMPAMLEGDELSVQGSVSAELLWRLEHGFQDLLLTALPVLQRVKINARDIVDGPTSRGPGVATGFSGGVDSFHTLIEFTSADCPARLKLTHLTFHVVGPEKKWEQLRTSYENLKPVAASMGLPFIKIESNMEAFFGSKLRMGVSHTLRDIAAASILRRGVGTYLYSSTVPYSKVKIDLQKGLMGYFDPVAVPTISTASFETIPVGAGRTRVQKTQRLATFELARKHLNVCLMQHGQAANCSRCDKCLRTLLCLEIAGHIDSFAHAFDLSTYRSERADFLKRVARDRHNVFLTELRDFASERNFRLPLLLSPRRWLEKKRGAHLH